MSGDRALRLLSNLILTRLLFPEAFGLMALVFVVIQGLQMLSDLGIGPSIIQNERGDDPTFLNTAWTLQILRGGVIYLSVVALSIPASWLYAEPRLTYLLPVVGFTALISGFDSSARHSVNRRLTLGRLTIFDLTAQFAALVVTIAWALVDRNVWALVGGAVAAALVRMAMSHFLLPGPKNRFAWDRNAVREVFHFGKWIFLSSAISLLAAQADRLILPKLITFELLGVYSIAYMLSQFPDQIVTSLSGRVVFPALSQLTHLPRTELRTVVVRNRRPFLLTIAVPLAVLAGFGDVLVRILYDARYHEAGWMLCLLALGLWPRMLTNTLAPALLAIGQPRYFAYAAGLRLLWVCGALPMAYVAFGLWGAVAAVACGAMAEYLIEGYGFWRHGLLCLKQDAVTTLLWAAALTAALGIRWAIGWPSPMST